MSKMTTVISGEVSVSPLYYVAQLCSLGYQRLVYLQISVTSTFHIGAHADHLVHMHRETLSKIRIEAVMRMATLPSMCGISED